MKFKKSIKLDIYVSIGSVSKLANITMLFSFFFYCGRAAGSISRVGTKTNGKRIKICQ